MNRSLAVQLTTRCNLACSHCFVEKQEEDLCLEIVLRLADYARTEGYRTLDLTGGEPTLYLGLAQVLEALAERSLGYTLVSNGWSLENLLDLIGNGAPRPSMLSLSLDGPDAESHDGTRRPGSFRRVLDSSARCRREGLPFGYRTTLLESNVRRLEELVTLAGEQGAGELALMPLIPTPASVREGQLLAPEALLRVLVEVMKLQESTPVHLVPTAGHFSLEILEPCPALAKRSLFVNARGEMALCCHLAGHEAAPNDTDLVVRLEAMGPTRAAELLEARVNGLRNLKRARQASGGLGLLDRFPCWFCLKHFGKVEWMRSFPESAWSRDLGDLRAS